MLDALVGVVVVDIVVGAASSSWPCPMCRLAAVLSLVTQPTGALAAGVVLVIALVMSDMLPILVLNVLTVVAADVD